MRAKKSFVFVFLILAALLVSACSLIKELKPTSFSLGATEIGYKSSLTADELIEMAVKEGYSERQVRVRIKGTSWENSEKVEAAIKKYYSKVRNLPSTFKEAATSEGYKTDISAEELIVLAKSEGYSQSEVLQAIKGSPWEKSNLVLAAIEKYYTNNADITAVLSGLKSDEAKNYYAETLEKVKSAENGLSSLLGSAISSVQDELSSQDANSSSVETTNASLNLNSSTKSESLKEAVQTSLSTSQKSVANFLDSNKTNDSFVFTSDNDSSLYTGEKLEVYITKSNSEILYNFKYTDRTKRIILENQTYKVLGKNVSLTNCDYKYHKTKITSKEDADTFTNLDYEIIKRYDAALKRHGYSSQNPMYR